MLLNISAAIVDLETTGTNRRYSRIIESGIIFWEPDNTLEYAEKLYNPEQSIPPFIESLTGISQHMVEDKPNFAYGVEALFNQLKDRLFIAHNVRFDYGFLKAAFLACGYDFRPKMLCTVRLAKLLYPDWPNYKLATICQQIGFINTQAHRALADAKATKAFIDYAIQDKGLDTVNSAAKTLIKTPTIPTQLAHDKIQSIPNTFGVYYFFNADGQLLYIGKSNHLRERIMSHLNNDVRSDRAMRMVSQIADIEVEVTAGELSALLQENRQIKLQLPVFNRKQRRLKTLWCLQIQIDKPGYKQLIATKCNADTLMPSANTFGFYTTKKQTLNALDSIIKAHHLCRKVNGDETGAEGSPCFGRQLKNCRGACEGAESQATYNLRVDLATYEKLLKPWPFEGPIALIENNLAHDICQVIYLDNWAWLTTETLPLNTDTPELLTANALASYPRQFDKDMYAVIKRAIKNPANRKEVLR